MNTPITLYEEKTMAKRKFWLGMLVMVLVFGMTVVGCEETTPAEVKVTNTSSFDIIRVRFTATGGINVKDDSSGILASESKTYEFDSSFAGRCIVTVKVGTENIEKEKSLSVEAYTGTKGIVNQYSVTLSGRTKENLVCY